MEPAGNGATAGWSTFFVKFVPIDVLSRVICP
jgi:hypothetical protein